MPDEQDPTRELKRERTELRRISRHLAGHGPEHPAEELERVAAWLRANPSEPDVYGSGALVEDFEREVGDLFDLPAARYMPSGCMAQPIALRIWSERAGNPTTAFHATSHLELHEQHGYRELHGLAAQLVGDAGRPTTAADVAALIGPGGAAHATGLASLLVELPAREIGGQLPTWDQLVELSALCRDEGIRVHLDGARVWQAAPAYGKSLAEVAALFDSVYVSFYKDVGGLAGAMLLGPQDFIDEAAVWQRRQGGTLHSSMTHIVSARMRLAACIARMPRLIARAREVAALFAAHERVRVLPDPPHTSMFHILLDGQVDALLEARDRVAREHGIWLFGGLRPTDEQGRSGARTELSMGTASLELSDDELEAASALLLS